MHFTRESQPRRGRPLRAATTLAANAAWAASCAKEAAAFARDTRRAGDVQRRLLLATVRANAGTAFGREHGFANVRTVADYRDAVPIRTFDEIAPYVDRVTAGEPGVLTAERVTLLEPTSGSTRPTKLVPYTASLATQFRRAISAWVFDLYARRRGLVAGASYWSASPAAREAATSPGGIPIGFEDDTEYLDPLSRRLARAVIAVPPEVRRVRSVETFSRVALHFLLRRDDLALVSVWNPTFFTILLERLGAEWPQISDGLRRGALGEGVDLEPELQRRLEARLAPDPARAREVETALRGGLSAEAVASVWPRLRLLSCWADGNAAAEAARLHSLMPHCELQPKGLLATEGVVSVPLSGAEGGALAIRSHYFEFLPEGESEAVCDASGLEVGARYEVVMTTGGGLYRYRLGDVVEVTGRLGECPTLRFVGRADLVSDWYGEKVSERHARAIVGSLFAVRPAFSLLSCEPCGARRAYTLFVECSAPAALEGRLEALLRENFHYAYCRDLGQLAPARVVRVRGGHAAYLEGCRARGQRLGDVKPAVLDPRGGWTGVLAAAEPV